MTELFLTLVNRSLAAGWLILAIILLRPFLRRVSRSICCALWGLVAFRLLCPFSIESVLSLIPSAEPIPKDFTALQSSVIDGGVNAGTQMGGELLPSVPQASPAVSPATVSTVQMVLQIVAAMWIIGFALFMLYAVLSYLRLRVRVQVSARQDGYWACERIRTPFVLGFFRPRIYMPLAVEERDIPYILAHERAHIARHDHWRKVVAFALLSVFWFHPFVWVAFFLLCRDIEFACDERALRMLGTDTQSKKDYAEALVRESFPRLPVLTCPLAFGGLQVKQRVLSVAKYRKPAVSLILAALFVCAAVGVCFLTDPKAGAGAPVDVPVDAPEVSTTETENPSEESTGTPPVTNISASWRDRYEQAEVIVMPVDPCVVDSENEACKQEAGKFTYCHNHLHTSFLSKDTDPSTVMLFVNEGDKDGTLTYLLVDESMPYGSEIATIFVPAGQKVAYDFGRWIGYVVIGVSYGDASAQFPLRAYTGT